MSKATNADLRRAAAYLPSHPHLAGVIAKAIADERARVLDEIEGLVERGGNPGEIGVLCEELKEGIQ